MASANVQMADWLQCQRQSRGWSMTKLATVACEAGLEWHAATVRRIEEADQPIKYFEALELSRIFESPLPVPAGQHPLACPTCLGNPPKSFTCNNCGRSS